MGLIAMLFLLLACGNLPEGNTLKYPPIPGVNSAKGRPREPQPFHCTKPTSPTKQELTSGQQTTKQLTTIPPTSPTKQELTSDQQTTNQLTTIPPTLPTKQELTSGQQSTKQLTTIPPTSPTKHELTSDQQTTNQLTTIPSTLPTKQELTSDQQTTKQLTSIPHTSPTKQEFTKQLISTPPTSPTCAPNMVLGPSCDCERTCQDPTSCKCTGPETCVCPDGFLMNNTECVPAHECRCYYNGGELVKNGYTYINDGCTERCTCINIQLSCDSAYTCSPHATCRVEDWIRQCYCNDGYVGDGETCKLYTDCYDAYQAGHRQDGIFTILPYGWSGSPFNVSCDMTTSGGGWTIIQRRVDRSLYFNRDWSNYRNGFGSPFAYHWLGNDKLFYLTNQRNYTLRFDLVSFDSSATYQEYSLFKIANESDNYRLIDLGSSSGTAGDGMDGSLGRKFSTFKMDNDECDDINCSNKHGYGGWWYSNEWCDECCDSNEPTCFSAENNCKKRCTKVNLNVIVVSLTNKKR